jgi:hypothetical protein
VNLAREYRKNLRLWAAIGGVALFASPAFAGTNSSGGNTEVTISISGSTALKNFVTGTGITDVTPGVNFTLNIGSGNVEVPPVGDTSWYSGGSFQLAPKIYNPASDSTVGLTQQVSGLRVEYHESGSAEGILEMANDQIAPVPYVEDNIDRNPNGGNAVWVNGNQIGGVSAPNNDSLTNGNDPNGNYLGPFYGVNTLGQIQTYGPGINATFNLAGVNTSNVVGSSNGFTQAGQNAVQLAVSDVVPVQVFVNANPSAPVASEPWLSTPQDYGYGMGNTLLRGGGLSISGGQVNLQNASALNMPASAINPRTGGTFGVGPWNTGGLTNLNSQTTAVSATLFVANPGTGLDKLDQTDADWLQTTGRLANGASFDMTTRDVNSGTRNVAALDTGIDPSFAVGVNDNGNGNGASGATTQISIGSGLRFSEKTAGGAQLRPTVQDARMAVGTLSVGDANGVFNTGDSYGLRALEYAPDTAQYTQANTNNTVSYVLVSAGNILDGAYVMYQNEQFVTLKAPEAGSATFAQMTTQQWAQVITGTSVVTPSNTFDGAVTAQGDDANSSVMQLVDNVQQGLVLQNFSTLATSGYSYLSKGFILPQTMEVEKPEDGIDMSSSNTFTQNAALTTAFLASSYTSFTTASNPDSIDSTPGDVYGGKGTNLSSFNSTIPITNSDNGEGGNYLFGNFNQNGIRDYDSVVVTAEEALGVLEASGLGTSAFSGASNSSVVPTSSYMLANSAGVTNTYQLSSALANMSNSVGGTGATKGDLIVMGDYDGRGVFDGLSLYELAIGASVADGTATPQSNTFGNGGSDHLTLQSLGTASYQVVNADGSTTTQTTETFGDAVRRGKLFKNTALDYLNNFATPLMKQQAKAVLEIYGTNVPSGATDLGPDVNYTGYEQYTFDPNGVNAYNKNDVNRDGTVDFNDAVLVDKFNGQDYTNMGDQIDATQQAPVTGASIPISLTVVSQTDTSTVIGSADLAIINQGLSVTNNANWYGYNLQKTGPGTIIWGRTAGQVTVYSGASFEVSSGTVDVGGTEDPFSDNTGSTATGSNHVAIAVDHGATLAFTQSSLKSTVGGLIIDTSTGSKVDIGTDTLAIDYAGSSDPISSIVSYLTTGFNGGSWTGAGLTSSAAQGNPGLYSIGYLNSTDSGGVPNQVIVKFTIAGDANLDGTVNFNDLLVVAQNFNKSGQDWSQGNFVYAANGLVNFADLLLVAQHFNDSLAGGGSPLALHGPGLSTLNVTDSTVPEPATTTLMAMGATGLLARRRRRARA